jgi:hypothetical protein
MEINACLFPASLHCALREISQGGDFSECKPTEKFQVDEFSEFRLYLGQFIEGIADRRQLFCVHGILDHIGLERRDLELSAAFDRVAVSSMVDDEPAHHTGGIPHEAPLVGKGLTFA